MSLDDISMDEIKESLSIEVNTKNVFKACKEGRARGRFFFTS